MVVLAAERGGEQAVLAIRFRIVGIVRGLILAPAGAALTAYERFRTEPAAVRG
jgi:hypothetical protein